MSMRSGDAREGTTDSYASDEQEVLLKTMRAPHRPLLLGIVNNIRPVGDLPTADMFDESIASPANGSGSGSRNILRPLIESAAGNREFRCSGLEATPMSARRVIAPLSLRTEVVLNTRLRQASFTLLQLIIRLLPACFIYGGTIAMITCAAFSYRWGVLFSLLLYSLYMCINSWEIVIFGTWGIIQCWLQSRNDWHWIYCKQVGKNPNACSDRGEIDAESVFSPNGTDSASFDADRAQIQWEDVFHIVMLPSYKTPYPVLVASLRALAKYQDSVTNMGVCLAFEEREDMCRTKAAALIKEFEQEFRFATAAFHPPNLARHIPGKSSNECWAFFELVKELKAKHNVDQDDPRVIITVIDDDSELHENYFEALTYHFLDCTEAERYLTIWQPPIVHFKNYLSQPVLVRTASLFTSLHELACLANPVDCHVPFSSYSLSLALASSVGGWDPDYISEDWHMMAKCCLRTEGRARMRPIFLPLLNYAPEEDTCINTVKSRWTQATRHALGVSEIVYIMSQTFVGFLEAPTLPRAIAFVWRMLPMIGKFCSVHFVVATLGIWPLLSHLLINVYMWRSWCQIGELHESCASCCVGSAASDQGIGEERVILHSWLVFFQQHANCGLAFGLVLAGGLGSFYFALVKDRVDNEAKAGCVMSNPLTHWVKIELECICFGWVSSLLFASIPEWIAAIRIIFTLQFHHVVAGMVGREDDDGGE